MKIDLDYLYTVTSIGDEIIMRNGSHMVVIHDYHNQDCCEKVYADFTHLNDTGFLGKEFGELILEPIAGFGFSINGFPVACYDIQNGCYDSDLTIIVHFADELIEYCVSEQDMKHGGEQLE